MANENNYVTNSFMYGSNANVNNNDGILNTEDFSDEVDEYENDQNFHRLSIVKRYNINIALFSPGSRIAEKSA